MTGQRTRVFARPQPAADLEARDAGQHPVEHDEVGWILGQAKLGLVAALDAFDDIAFGFEIVGEQQREIGFVLDDKDARRGNRARARGFSARLIHASPPAASISMSVSCRPRGRSDVMASPVTR